MYNFLCLSVAVLFVVSKLLYLAISNSDGMDSYQNVEPDDILDSSKHVIITNTVELCAIDINPLGDAFLQVGHHIFAST